MSEDTTNGELPDATEGVDDEDELIAQAAIDARRGGLGHGNRIGMPTEKSDKFVDTLKRLGEILGREAWLLMVVLCLTLASVVCIVVGPRLLGQATDVIVDGVTGDGIDFGQLHRQLGRVAALYLAAWTFAAAQSYLLAGVVQRSMYALRESVERKINRLPLSYIDRHSRGDLLSRVTNDIDNLSQSLSQTVSTILQGVLLLVGVAIMMFLVSPLLAVVALVMVPVSLGMVRYIGAKARPRYLSQWRYTGVVNGQAEEVFTGHAIVKSFGRQRQAEEKFEGDNDRLYEATFGAAFVSGLIQPLTVFVGNLQFVLMAVVGGLRISSGAMTIGDMQAMIQYVRQFSQPMTQLASMASTFQSGIASLERVLELLDAEEMSEEQAATVDPQPVQGRIVFDHVSFAYLPDQPLISDLSVVAEPGQTIAIVGPTGAGKTTIVNLLMRFYELDDGSISIDGRNIASMPRSELRKKIGMVLQDTWLFGGTIRENLAYGNPDATDEQIMEAARATYVDRFVRRLPDGYDTIINDEGDNISAGEKQLMTIARAFLSDPSILILDEATSSVDTRTEVMIQEAMNALRASRTSFVIAHRLSTIRGADVILVMEAGRIVEQGNHDALIQANGAYARLYNAQFAGQPT